jgi:hypothetical protein
MCPSGNMKIFSAGAACFADEACTTDPGTTLVAGATSAAVEAGAKARFGVGSVASFSVAFESRQDQFLAVSHIRQVRG